MPIKYPHIVIDISKPISEVRCYNCKRYQQIRPINEPQMTIKEISDLALENVRRQLENERIKKGYDAK